MNVTESLLGEGRCGGIACVCEFAIEMTASLTSVDLCVLLQTQTGHDLSFIYDENSVNDSPLRSLDDHNHQHQDCQMLPKLFHFANVSKF